MHRIACVIVFLVVLTTCMSRACAQEPLDDAQVRLQAALENRISLDLKGKTLRDFAQTLREKLRVSVVINAAALQALEVSESHPLRGQYEEETINDVLDSVLRQAGLGWVAVDGVLLFTFEPTKDALLTTRILDVRNLRDWHRRRGGLTDFASQVSTWIGYVAPETWSSNGGPGDVKLFGNKLVVRQTAEVHAKVEERLQLIGLALGHQQGLTERTVFGRPSWLDVQKRQMLKRGNFSYVDASLTTVVEDINKRFGLQIVIQTGDTSGLTGDEELSLDLQNVPVRIALQQIAAKLGTTYACGERIELGMEPGCENTRCYIYSVGDLLEIDPHETTRRQNARRLKELVTRIVDDQKWDSVGGASSIVVWPTLGLALVDAEEDTHDAVAVLFCDLRAKLAEDQPIGETPQDAPVWINRTLWFDSLRTSDGPSSMLTDLAEKIPRFVDPASWKRGEGEIAIVGKHRLLIRQTRRNHDRILDLLADLRITYRPAPALPHSLSVPTSH